MELTGGLINNKKNYKPDKHKDSYTLTIKIKEDVFSTLKKTTPFLRVIKKKNRANWILNHYEYVTPRNGKYSPELLERKVTFEKLFFEI